jgi:uncharacterized cupin superfamily protein
MTDGLPFRIEDVPSQRWEHGDLRVTRRRLGLAAGARRLGIALIEIEPGKRSTPPHSHADEEELFLVLAGSGLSYQSSGRGDVRTYAIGVDDVLWHPSNGDAHALVAGNEGLTVLVVAEGSRTHITYLPRTGQFWLGAHWTPADSPHPFAADAELGPLELPEPAAERPPTIRAIGDAREIGSDRLVLAQDDLPPRAHATALHFHTTREEAWFVRGGSGIARLGDDAHPLEAGSFWLRRENAGIGHRIEAGPEGMQLVTMGDLIPGDVCVYPEKRTFKVAQGLEIQY